MWHASTVPAAQGQWQAHTTVPSYLHVKVQVQLRVRGQSPTDEAVAGAQVHAQHAHGAVAAGQLVLVAGQDALQGAPDAHHAARQHRHLRDAAPRLRAGPGFKEHTSHIVAGSGLLAWSLMLTTRGVLQADWCNFRVPPPNLAGVADAAVVAMHAGDSGDLVHVLPTLLDFLWRHTLVLRLQLVTLRRTV